MTHDYYMVYDAIGALSRAGRTVNNSQLAARTGLSRKRVQAITWDLEMRGYIKDTGKGRAAYHWRHTGEAMPPRPASEPGPEGLARMFPLGGAR